MSEPLKDGQELPDGLEERGHQAEQKCSHRVAKGHAGTVVGQGMGAQ